MCLVLCTTIISICALNLGVLYNTTNKVILSSEGEVAASNWSKASLVRSEHQGLLTSRCQAVDINVASPPIGNTKSERIQGFVELDLFGAGLAMAVILAALHVTLPMPHVSIVPPTGRMFKQHMAATPYHQSIMVLGEQAYNLYTC